MNKNYKYIIIGGGAAGVSAAETIRANDPTGTIGVISDEPYPLYSRVMLSKPNFFLGKIPFDQIFMKGNDWYAENHIDFLGGKMAIMLDVANKTISLSDNSQVRYEKLLIATGVNVRKWPVTGANKKGIHYLRTLEDGRGIMEGIKTAKRAVTIGGGFISFEMADMLHLAGLDVTSVIMEPHFWSPILDEKSGFMLENALIKAGVKMLKKSQVTEVLGGDSVEGVNIGATGSPTTDRGQTSIPCEMIVCGIGTVNPIEWLKDTSVKTNRGILANEYMETSAPDVWTAGDIAEYHDLLLEENIEMGNWVSAKEQGRIAGLNMSISSGVPIKSPDGSLLAKQAFKFVSFYTTSGFGVSIAFVGDVNVSDDRIIIPRGSPEINSYGRLMIDKKGELVGATLISRVNEMNTIAKLIEKNIKVGDKQKELADVNFDLKTLLV